MALNKYLAIALVAGLVTAGCTSESSKTETTNTEIPTTKTTEKALPEPEIEPIQKPDSLYSYQLSNDPFGIGQQEQTTPENYLAKINGAYSLKKKPVQNRHLPNQTDTVLTIQSNESRIELYQAKGPKILLLSAKIKDPEIALRDGFAVGMSKTDLLNRLNELNYKWAAKGKNVVVSDEMGLTNLTFILAHEQVARIEYEGYVD